MHADEVISVHDSMNKTIQKNREVNITIIVDLGVEPIKQENGRVVVNVQEAQLTPLFVENNKNGIPKVPDLGSVKEPQELSHRRIFCEHAVAGEKGIVISVRQHASLDCHVGTKHNLRNVINKFQRVWVNSGGTYGKRKSKIANSHGKNSQLSCTYQPT